MPPPYEVILARVKQKIATESEWLLVEDDLGVLFEGEQAFVVDDNGLPVNFKIGDGTKKFSELPYFLAYYDGIQSQKRLIFPLQSTDITIANTFRNNSSLYDLIFNNTSGGEIALRIGTTVGGNEVAEFDVPIGLSTISLKQLFNESVTLYFSGLAGNSYSLTVIYYQYDESPVIPAPGQGSGNSFYKKGTMGMFVSLYDGHENDVWDFLTGLGKPGSGYDNCALMGTNQLPSMANMYPVGASTGETIGARKGNTDNTAPIGVTNLPASGVGLFKQQIGTVGGDVPAEGDNISRARLIPGSDLNYEIVRSTSPTAAFVGKSANLGDGTELNIQPDSRIVLYFIAIE